MELGVSKRRIGQLYAEFRRTGLAHVPLKPGRRMRQPTPEETETVMDVHKAHPAGVLYTAKRLRRMHDISYGCTYRIMKEAPSPPTWLEMQAFPTCRTQIPSPAPSVSVTRHGFLDSYSFILDDTYWRRIGN